MPAPPMAADTVAFRWGPAQAFGGAGLLQSQIPGAVDFVMRDPRPKLLLFFAPQQGLAAERLLLPALRPHLARFVGQLVGPSGRRAS